MLYLVYVDIDMYDDTTDTCAEPRSTIVTDLGQIQYIFTDKTGTLTQNVMRFKRCSIDGTCIFIYFTPFVVSVYLPVCLSVCVCLCMYVCMYVCMYARMYTALILSNLALLLFCVYKRRYDFRYTC